MQSACNGSDEIFDDVDNGILSEDGDVVVDSLPKPTIDDWLALHAWSLSFVHPITREKVRIVDPPKERFVNISKRLGVWVDTLEDKSKGDC